MTVQAAVRQMARELHADWHEAAKPAFELTLAKRDTGMDLRLLRYRVELEYNDPQRIVFFEETLSEETRRPKGMVELGAGLKGKEETFRIIPPSEKGTIEEQAAVFASRYTGIHFDFAALRQRLAEVVETEGYRLKHLVPL